MDVEGSCKFLWLWTAVYHSEQHREPLGEEFDGKQEDKMSL